MSLRVFEIDALTKKILAEWSNRINEDKVEELISKKKKNTPTLEVFNRLSIQREKLEKELKELKDKISDVTNELNEIFPNTKTYYGRNSWEYTYNSLDKRIRIEVIKENYGTPPKEEDIRQEIILMNNKDLQEILTELRKKFI